jgi:VanZ family protein
VVLGAVAVLLTVLYGASDEFHQSFVPSRQMDVMDLVADGAGAAAAAGALYIWSRTTLAKVR